MKRLAILVLIPIGLAACSTLKKSVDKMTQTLGIVEHVEAKAPPARQETPEEYRTALALLEQRKCNEALGTLDKFLQANPVSPWTQAAQLNAGRALECLARWTEAAERFRGVVQATSAAQKLQTMALYRLSFAYEALDQDQQVIATLSDLEKRKRNLPEEIANGEMPARMAAAYARVGNFDRAVYFYRQAETGIARLRQETGGKIPEWLPRTLFFMGEMSRRAATWDGFELVLRPLGRGQIYLLQAAELGQSPWSDRAADDLVAIYESLWNAIRNAPVAEDGSGDPLLAQRALQKVQWDRAVLLYDSIEELKARVLVSDAAPNNPPTTRIKKLIDTIENRVAMMMLERPAGEGLTREALLRKQAIRGKVISPDDSLERKFLKDGREAGLQPSSPPKKTVAPTKLPHSAPLAEPQPAQVHATPAPAPTSEHAPIRSEPKSTSSEDPNL